MTQWAALTISQQCKGSSTMDGWVLNNLTLQIISIISHWHANTWNLFLLVECDEHFVAIMRSCVIGWVTMIDHTGSKTMIESYRLTSEQ